MVVDNNGDTGSRWVALANTHGNTESKSLFFHELNSTVWRVNLTRLLRNCWNLGGTGDPGGSAEHTGGGAGHTGGGIGETDGSTGETGGNAGETDIDA